MLKEKRYRCSGISARREDGFVGGPITSNGGTIRTSLRELLERDGKSFLIC